jgi:hypothetical protein
MVVSHRDERGNIDMLDVVFNRGDQHRIERSILLKAKEKVEALGTIEAALGATAESMLAWAHSYKAPYVTIYLYDGRYLGYAAKQEDGTWKRRPKELSSKNLNPLQGMDSLGWPEYLVTNASISQNDYSRQHGLLCFETRLEAQVEDGVLRFPAEKRLHYIDPNKNYLCVRQEKFYNNTYRLDRRTKVADLDFDPNVIPDKPAATTEITEFAKTPDGKWYPTRIKSAGGSDEIHLITDPNFPDGIFDCDKLPN